ncbi:MAG: acetate--CoA ligase family protein [Eubacteriales bacterium]|nr:acetate--CoA ligase family protein [Eubacteriales bacterium]
MLSDGFFFPGSVAIIGASETPGRIGSGLYKSMRPCVETLWCVNPNRETLFGEPCYRSVEELPGRPSHAWIAVRRDLVLPYLRACAAADIRNVVVISAGFKETDAAGAALEREISVLAQREKMNILGPNTLGFIHTGIGFNGSFLPAEFERGGISVISQSGGVGMALLASLADQRCGVAKWVGVGNEAGITALEVLEYLAEDEETRAIAVCFEGLRELPRFLRRAAEVNRVKPVVLLRDGKSRVGLQAAASHTGAMVYAGNVLPSLFNQFGLLEAASCRDCAVMLKALSLAPRAAGERAVLLTNTAGPSVLAADRLEELGVSLPPVPETLRREIDEEAGIPMGLKNPADISSNGLDPRNYGIAARRLLASESYDLLLGFFSLNDHLRLPEEQLIDAARLTGKPAVACFLSTQRRFAAYPLTPEHAGIPCFCDPQDAAVAAAAILRYGEALRRKEQAPPALKETQEQACAAWLATFDAKGGERLLSERESRELLRLAGAELTVPLRALSAEEAAEAAEYCGFPAALKLESRHITHKSAVGGVRLHLASREAVLAAAEEMLPRLRALDPDAALSVQPMAGDGFEMILGAVRSPLGVLLMAGMGGSFAESIGDDAFCALPAGREDMRRMLRALRCAGVLYTPDGTPLLDEAGLLDLLEILAGLMAHFPQIAELEINPCRVAKDRVSVLDARTVLRYE